MKSSVLSLGLLLVSLLVLGCASRSQPSPRSQQRDYKVEVFSDGEKVEQFEQQRVHRVEVPEKSIRIATKSWPRGLNLPFGGINVNDRSGELLGIQLVSSQRRKRLPRFGLKNGDLLTAVGNRRLTRFLDLYWMFEELNKKGESSVSLRRGGKTHKILYTAAARVR